MNLISSSSTLLLIFSFLYTFDPCNNLSEERYRSRISLIDNEFQLHWTAEPLSDKIHIGMLAKTSGWVGFGISNIKNHGMALSEAVVGWLDENPWVHSYYMSKRSGKGLELYDETIPLFNTSVCREMINGSEWTIAHYTRAVSQGLNPIHLNGTLTPFVVAFGPKPEISYHDGKKEVGFIDFSKGGVETKGRDPRKIAHAILLFLSWGVILQFGSFFARYAKLLPNSIWFKVHRVSQLVGFCISIAGFILAFVMVEGRHLTRTPHDQLGIAIMGLGLIQVVVAVIRPHQKLETKSAIRSIWEFTHWWAGRLALLLSLLNIYYGLKMFQVSPAIMVSYIVWITIIILSYAAFEIHKKLREDSSPKGYKLVNEATLTEPLMK